MIVFTKLNNLLTKKQRMIPPCLVQSSFKRLCWWCVDNFPRQAIPDVYTTIEKWSWFYASNSIFRKIDWNDLKIIYKMIHWSYNIFRKVIGQKSMVQKQFSVGFHCEQLLPLMQHGFNRLKKIVWKKSIYPSQDVSIYSIRLMQHRVKRFRKIKVDGVRNVPFSNDFCTTVKIMQKLCCCWSSWDESILFIWK